MFDAPLGQHLRAAHAPMQHRLGDFQLVSHFSSSSAVVLPQNLQATPELAQNSSLLERAELHYQECNRMLDS